MCRDDVRRSRNIAINVVLQYTFCVNFFRFNMAALQKISCRQMSDPSFSRPTLLCFGGFSSNHITGKRYPEMDMDRTVNSPFGMISRKLVLSSLNKSLGLRIPLILISFYCQEKPLGLRSCSRSIHMVSTKDVNFVKNPKSVTTVSVFHISC